MWNDSFIILFVIEIIQGKSFKVFVLFFSNIIHYALGFSIYLNLVVISKTHDKNRD